MVQFLHRDFFSVAYSIWVRRVASAYLLSEPTIFLGKCLYQVRNVLFFSCSVDWKLRWLSFLSVLSVFVDFPFRMRLGVRYHCYYLYSVVCQQIWRKVLPLFFPRYTGVKTQIATLRWADVGLRAFGSLARRRNPTLAHRNVTHWRHVGPTFGLQPYANPIPPLSNVGPTSVKTVYNHVPI